MILQVAMCSLVLLGTVDVDRAAHAGTLQWTDENGTSGFTDNLLNVPQTRRGGVEVRKQARSSYVRPHPDVTEDATLSRTTETVHSGQPIEIGSLDDRDIGERERWRKRLQTAKANIVERRAKRSEVEQQLVETRRGMWMTFGPGASDLEKRKHMPELEREITTLDREITQFEDEVNITIPRDARRAGIPLGWLR